MENIIKKAIEGGWKHTEFPRYNKNTGFIHFREYDGDGVTTMPRKTMRTIKFRAWDKELKLMSPVGRIDFGKTALIYQPETLNEDMEYTWTGADIPLERLELMQFTGLLDKNGKEIYEGDLLKNGAEGFPAEVIFKDGCFYVGRYRCELYRFAGENKEIIGNIYETPNPFSTLIEPVQE